MTALDTPRGRRAVLAIILAASLALNIYGSSFGLPYRWNVDETVAAAMRVAGERSLIWGDIRQPHFHTYILALLLAPYLGYAVLTRDDVPAIRAAAAVSWNELATVAPDFASTVYRIARILSALIGAATVFAVYRLATVLWRPRVGVMAAALLAVSQGFVGSSHFARSEPLVNFFGVLVLYLFVRSFEPGPRQRRYFFLGAFFAGLGFATKYNGLVLVGTLGLAWLWLSVAAFREDAGTGGLGRRLLRGARLPWLLGAAVLYVAGIFVGQPTLLDMLARHRDVTAYWGLYFASGAPGAPTYAASVVNYLLQLVAIYGIPLSLFVGAGLAVFLYRGRGQPTAPGAALVLATSAAYFLTTCLYPWPQPWTKFIIFVVPLLAVFGGAALADFAAWTRVPVSLRVAVLLLVFGYSLAYSLSVDVLLARRDIRYESTRWIEAHIPRGASIEHVQEEAWLYSPRILTTYDIVYFGRHSRTYRGSLFKRGPSDAWRPVKHEYITSLLERKPQADYFMLWIEDVGELERTRGSRHPQDRLVQGIVSGELGYRLVRRFESANYRVPAIMFSGVYYPRSFWWRPTTDYTPAEIRIYQRVDGRSALAG